MPNSSKIAFIFHGEPKAHPTATPLKYLGDDVRKMKTILRPLWSIKKEGFLERSFFSKESLSHYKAEELDVFFYFTGHGIDYQYGESIEYTLMLSHDNKQNITIKELVKDVMTHLSPKTLTIVLDACYSGQAEIETNSDRDIQLLSSSNYTQESYESWGVGGGLFTHFFCRAIESACGKDKTGKITLGDIAEDIREPLQKRRQDIVSKSINLGELSHLAIAYNKEIWEIKQVLKENFSIKQFKDKIFEFLDKDNLGFKEALVAEDFNALLWILIKYKREALYCICQELDFSNSYIDAFKTDKCANFKEKAQNNREVKKVILRIHQSSSGSTDNCWVEGWLQLSIDVTEPLEKLNIDFSSDYISVLSDYIAKALQDKFLAKSPLDLDLILDDGLFRYDFYPLVEKHILMITTQFLSRNKNFFSSKVATVWKNNSELFEEKKLEPIEKYIYPIDEVYEKGDIMYCFTDNKIVVNSAHNLLTIQYLEMIKKLGLPFVISPCSDIPTKVNFKWKNATMNDLKNKVIIALSKHYKQVNSLEKNIQFIYDNYHDVAKFKEIINETDEKIKG